MFLYVFDPSRILNQIIFTFGCGLAEVGVGWSLVSIGFTDEGMGGFLDNSSLHNSISDASKESTELLIYDRFHLLKI